MSEVKITKRLCLLKDGGRNRTSAFVELFGTWIVWDYGLNSTEYKQLYVVYKTEYAGMPLQEFVHSLSLTADQVDSITRQVALALSVAECELNFEHRDLHPETVLIRPTSRSQLTFRMDGESHSVNSCGYKATIVNFSASRATIKR
ncbi:hypothetical protein LAZ67_10003261 [Cordylochernes scorpioides]|uniref:Protein kinase domain-containing protein n=1 Tax=Cordylochernes scorpioides TaxID=51811 RepID=A0ABY6KX33_9ARAC|nr:hypothetical protein LAZ67_10003261 [Cordylochernes scorpioides]